MKKYFLGILTGLFFALSAAYAANYLYHADEVSYDPKDTNWDVTDVDSAIKELYNRVSESNSALVNLKNTDIAKAVGANGDTFSSVINKLSGITNHGDKSFTVNGTNSITIPAGYYNGQGTISTSGLIPTPTATLTLSDITNGTDVTNYKTVKTSGLMKTPTATLTLSDVTSGTDVTNYKTVKTSGLMKTPTATKSITSNGSNIDVTNYAKVNVSVANVNSDIVVISEAYSNNSNNLIYGRSRGGSNCSSASCGIYTVTRTDNKWTIKTKESGTYVVCGNQGNTIYTPRTVTVSANANVVSNYAYYESSGMPTTLVVYKLN